MSALHTRLTVGTYDYPPPRIAVTSATPMVMPSFAIASQQRGAHSDLYYEALSPIIAADGAIIPGSSGQLPPDVMPAGRP